MNIPVKKLHNGFTIPVFGIGTWRMGGGLNRDTDNDKKDIDALKAAIDLGITHIDTAEVYGDGHSEELVGEVIKNYERSKLFIVSKVSQDHLQYEDVLNSCKKSLQRLQIDYLDLYLIHGPNPQVPLVETMRALDQLKNEGLIKQIGVSNFSVDQLQKVKSLTKNKIVCNQIHYNLAYQDLQNVVHYCGQNDIFITAYRPIERGVLTQSGITILDEMCKKYHKTPAQIALNWLVSQENIITISKMSSTEHVKENLGALNWEMEKDDIEKLVEEFPEVALPPTVIKLKK